MSKTLEYRNAKIREKVEDQHKNHFDPEVGMLVYYYPPFNNGAGGYHTRKSGNLHHTNAAVMYADNVFYLGIEEYYDEARSCLWGVINAQDTREDSPTFGLWASFIEEPLDEMLAPDYNLADFNARHLAHILKKKSHLLDDELKEAATKALYRAAQCSIKRNVSPDYTNISFMSLNTIVCAGELCGNEAFFKRGKERLKKVRDYNMIAGTFTEFNAPSYGPLALEEIGRMMYLFEDEECKEWASEMNYIGWEMILSHYHKELNQICPPNMRSYSSVTASYTQELIYLGTDGEFGKIGEHPGVGAFISPSICPDELIEKYLRNTPEYPVFMEETFYKKNDLRTPDEDTVIVRNLNSPDLNSYSYMTDSYLMGAFEKTDMWTQRRSSMICWGKNGKMTTFRIRCMNDDYDYCSGMVYTRQFENVALSHAGFVTDHGDFHYILDKEINSTLTTKKLWFKFELEGDCGEAKITQNGNRFTIADKGMTIDLNIVSAYFDGKPMEIKLNEEGNFIEAVCFCGERTVDFARLSGKTCMVFTMAANAVAGDVETKEENGTITSTLKVGDITLSVSSPKLPVKFDEAIETVKTKII